MVGDDRKESGALPQGPDAHRACVDSLEYRMLMIVPETGHLCIYTRFKSIISDRNKPDWSPSPALPEMPAAGERSGTGAWGRRGGNGPSCLWLWRLWGAERRGHHTQGESSASGGTWPPVPAQALRTPRCLSQQPQLGTAALQVSEGTLPGHRSREQMPGLHATGSHSESHALSLELGAQKAIHCRQSLSVDSILRLRRVSGHSGRGLGTLTPRL